ncbi:unnamed protein product, partial [Mesorhabditis belari]|uniref:Uncharacterized protein n=1 Tax=Mesorhabditis belari TaxID=2138241 RepID=A0AAF3F707_9BILA
MIFIAYKATPMKMLAYRKHLFDSLISSGLYSLTVILFFTFYGFQRENDTSFNYFSVSLIYSLNLGVPLRPLLALQFLAGVNCARAIIFCFKFRFEAVVYGKLKDYYSLYHKYFLNSLFTIQFPIIAVFIWTSTTPTDFQVVLCQTSIIFSMHQIIVQPLTSHITVLYLSIILVILLTYALLLGFYIIGTYVLLYLSKKVAFQQSAKTLKAQKFAFWMLLLQTAFSLWPAVLASLLLIATFFSLSSEALPAFNFIVWFLIVPFGFLYPFAILLTTKPYLKYVINLLARGMEKKISTVSWVSPLDTNGRHRLS